MSAVDPEVLYVALVSDPGLLRAQRRLQYRCTSRCLLLDAIAVPAPERILLHQKRYKLSPQWNATRSSEAGRAANTYDGDNHWKSWTYYVGTSALDLADPGAVLDAQCDHVSKRLKPLEFNEHWHRGHTEVRVRADGTMFVVR